jgi:hypothetical protein
MGLNSRRARVYVATGLVAFIVIGTVLGAVVSRSGGGDTCRNFRFDPVKWQQARLNVNPPTDRQEIADDLLRCHRLDDLSKTEVLQMLGPGVPRLSNTSRTMWVTGLVRESLSTGREYLRVNYDANGTVVSAALANGE